MDPAPILWLVIVGAAAVIGCAFLIQPRAKAAGLVLCSSIVGLVPLFVEWMSTSNAPRGSAASFLRVSAEPGLWLTLIGLASALATAAVVLLTSGSHDHAAIDRPWMPDAGPLSQPRDGPGVEP